jgi:hypothetical protein
MNSRLPFLLILLVSLAPALFGAEGKLISVDVAGLTVEENGARHVYRAKAFTEVTINGEKSALNQLRPGMQLTITLADADTASRIVAHGMVGFSTTVTNTPAKPGVPKGTPRSIVIRMKIDGHERIRYRDGQLWIEHVSNGKPQNITVNGVEWKPVWTGDTSEPLTKIKPHPTAMGQSKVTFTQTAGREKGRLEEPPATGNFDYIPTIDISDAPGGDDVYEFVLSW